MCPPAPALLEGLAGPGAGSAPVLGCHSQESGCRRMAAPARACALTQRPPTTSSPRRGSFIPPDFDFVGPHLPPSHTAWRCRHLSCGPGRGPDALSSWPGGTRLSAADVGPRIPGVCCGASEEPVTDLDTSGCGGGSRVQPAGCKGPDSGRAGPSLSLGLERWAVSLAIAGLMGREVRLGGPWPMREGVMSCVAPGCSHPGEVAGPRTQGLGDAGGSP